MGIGRSVHIQASQQKPRKEKNVRSPPMLTHPNIVPIPIRSQTPPSKLGWPTNNPVCARIIRPPPKQKALEVRVDIDENAIAGRLSGCSDFEFGSNYFEVSSIWDDERGSYGEAVLFADGWGADNGA